VIRTISCKALVFLAGALGMAGVAWSADATSPLAGKWVLNVAKSTFDPPPALKSNVFVITEAPSGAIHQTVDYVEDNGNATHMELTTAFDGKEVPVTGGGEADSVIATQPKPGRFHYVFKKAGKWVESATFHVSADGKSLRGWIHGVDTQGKWKYHYVFDRQ